MKHSIFTRYLTAFIVIIIVSFTILTMIVASMTIQTTNDERKNGAREIANSLSAFITEQRGDTGVPIDLFVFANQTQISNIIRVLASNVDLTAIMLTYGDGTILASTSADYTGIITDASITDMIAGGISGFKYTDFNGLMSEKCGAYILPCNGPTAASQKIESAIIVCYPAGEIDALSTTIIKTIIVASLWVMIATFVAIYFISEKIVSPLKQMSIATRNFAAGQFDTKIPVVGNDEIAELATAFNSMADSLAKLEYMRSSFLANVSHDLRTPMTTISGFIDGILDGAIPQEKQPYYLSVIAGEVRRLSRLVSSLLDISRIQAGDRKFTKSSFDICEMARLILISFEAKIEQKKLDVELDCPDGRIYVFSDHDAIYQVIYNLCDNAAKFSREGGKYRLRIVPESDFVTLSVYNEGSGIPAEDLPFVFDRFYKSDKSRGLDKTGVGLGLYIVKTMVDTLGESISVSSEEGKYCEFDLRLRRSKPESGKSVK